MLCVVLGVMYQNGFVMVTQKLFNDTVRGFDCVGLIVRQLFCDLLSSFRMHFSGL